MRVDNKVSSLMSTSLCIGTSLTILLAVVFHLVGLACYAEGQTVVRKWDVVRNGFIPEDNVSLSFVDKPGKECVCKNRCYAHPQCKAASVSLQRDGSVKCSLSFDALKWWDLIPKAAALSLLTKVDCFTDEFIFLEGVGCIRMVQTLLSFQQAMDYCREVDSQLFVGDDSIIIDILWEYVLSVSPYATGSIMIIGMKDGKWVGSYPEAAVPRPEQEYPSSAAGTCGALGYSPRLLGIYCLAPYWFICHRRVEVKQDLLQD